MRTRSLHQSPDRSILLSQTETIHRKPLMNSPPKQYMATTYKMRKAQIFSPVLPKTLLEYQQREHLKEDIQHLEDGFYRGGYQNPQFKTTELRFHRKLKDIQSKLPKFTPKLIIPKKKEIEERLDLSQVLQLTFNIQDGNVSAPSVPQEASKPVSHIPTHESDTSYDSDSNVLRNNVQQTNIYKQHNHVWSSAFQRELRKNIQELQDKWQRFLEEDEQEDKDQGKLGLSWLCDKVGMLDLESLQFVTEEIQKPVDQRNYFEIDRVLLNLRFFQRFPKGVRIGILESCTFLFKAAGQALFKQDEDGSEMFIIIRGCVTVRQNKLTSFGKMWDTMIASLYDGSQVGDQSQVENNKRSVTALATEDCHLLVMQRQQYEQVLIKAVEREMEQKIKVIHNVKFLKQCLPVQLIPLAAVLQPQAYEMGEYLIKQQHKDHRRRDEEIPCLFFITKGSCDVVYEKRSWRETNNLLIPTQRTRFQFKEQRDLTCQYPSRDESEKLSLHYPPNKSFDHTNKKRINKRFMEVTEHVPVGQLKMGDVAGGRIVFTFEKIEQKKRRNAEFEKLYGRDLNTARLSLIASSCTVETFTLDYKQFQTMPESLQNTMYRIFVPRSRNGLVQQSEFDEVSVDDVRQQHQRWSTVKQAYYRGLIQYKQIRHGLGLK